MQTTALIRRLPRLLVATNLSVVLALGIVMSAGAAAVAEPGHTSDAEQACTSDVMRLCSEFIPDSGRIVACLKQKRFMVSAACTTALTPKTASISGKKKKRRPLSARSSQSPG